MGVYTVSSQLGFEAIFAGHKPRVFGQPFYAGWGLTEDRHPHALTRRGRALTRAQLFAAAMILYPTWYDPYHDTLCELEDAIDHASTPRPAPGARITRAGWPAACACGNANPCSGFSAAHGTRVIFRDEPTEHGRQASDDLGRKGGER